MKNPYRVLVFFFCSLVFFSCTTAPKTKVFQAKPDYNKIDIQKLDSAIKLVVTSFTDTTYQNIKWLKQIYAERDYKSVWINYPYNKTNADTLLSYLGKVEAHGLKSSQFAVDTLTYLSSLVTSGKLSYNQLAYLDMGLSKAFLTYCTGLKFGFVRPDKTCSNHYFPTMEADSAFVEHCFENIPSGLSELLMKLQPTSKTYLALQAEKLIFNRLVDSACTPIPLLGEKERIKFGKSHSSLPLIARRLMITGELPYDSAYQTVYQTFDKTLLTALDLFRDKTGLLKDKEIGNNTINALNMTFPEYVDKINANLERLRWQPLDTLGRKNIRVNVADMTLEAYRGDTVALTMNICVGKPPKTITPFLQSKIYEIVMNPTWTIPNSIIVKEISKIVVKDTSYLARHFIKVFKKKVEVLPSSVDWLKLTKKYQPYTLIQDSGDLNSLGRIKFNFGNHFSVYLHDTNSKSAFRRHNRAISHGCIRVEKPLELTYFCLPEPDSITLSEMNKISLLKDKIRYSIGRKVLSKIGKDSLRSNPEQMKLQKVRITPNIPILIYYRTCFLNPNGTVQFKPDMYDLDKELISLLNKVH